MNLPPPMKGASDLLGASEQAPLTSRDVLNMRPFDPSTDRARMSQRSGLAKYMEDTLAGSAVPVVALDQVTFQQKTVDYAEKASTAAGPLGASDVNWDAQTPSKKGVPAISVDRQGNVFAIDGLAGVVKFNSAGLQQWKIALPAPAPDAQVRALAVATVGFVDADGDAVFTGVSSGGSQALAAMWCHKQISTTNAQGTTEIKTELVWEFRPGAFIEMMKVRDSLLYTIQNEPDTGRAWMRVYYQIATAQPDLAFSWEIPYPANGMDVKAEDGVVITCHEPNTLRGINPQYPTFTARDLAREWTLRDLTDYDKRIWMDLDASKLKEDLDIEDGDAVTVWPDQGPSGRHLVQTGAVALQPTYAEKGIGGLPSVRFSGAITGLTNHLLSLTNPTISPAYDDQQRTPTPAYTGGPWAMFIVMRPANEATIRPAYRRDNEIAGALAAADTLCINKDSTTAVATTGAFNGKLTWLTSVDATNGSGAGSLSAIPHAADWIYSGSTGAAIITILHDGNANATSDTAQHSLFRVNGRPIDRYCSLDDSGLTAAMLGGPGNGALTTYFNGDIARIIVLRDYSTGGGHGNPATGAVATGGTTHYPRTLGAPGSSSAVAYGAAAGNRFNDNEIERIEGMLAGEYGLAHILPCGTAAKLVWSANSADTETVTVDGRVYTWRAALTAPPVADEILVGASAAASASNFMRALNNTGTIGTDYSFLTVEHATVRATQINVGAAAAPIVKVETKGLTAVSVSETMGTAAWNVGTTTTLATEAGSVNTYMPGHYPHPFNVHYGYPRKDSGATVGSTLESKGKMLASTEGILARWNANGSIAWVLTSRSATVTPGGTLPATNQYFGGIGYSCAFGITTGIYSAGPMCTASAATQNEQAALRRCVDNVTSVSAPATATGLDLALGTWALTPSLLVGAGANSSIDYKYLRIAVDTFDNVYLPYHETASTQMTAVVVKPAGTVVALHFKIQGSDATGAQTLAGQCIAIDPKLPEYQGDPVTRAFAWYVGTGLGYTRDLSPAVETIYKVEGVTATSNTNSPRATNYVGVSAGRVMQFTDAGPTEPGGASTTAEPALLNPVLSSAAKFVATAQAFGNIYITDGRADVVYRGKLDKLARWKSQTAGDMKARARILCAWRGRLLRARFADDAHEIQGSALGNPEDFDISPPVQSATQAFLFSKAVGIGRAPDIVNALCPYSDDLLIIFCQSSIYRLDGDPMDGGRLSIISDATGGSFGNSWCKDEGGVVYFHGTRGAVYRMVPGRAPEDISGSAIPARLRSVNLETHRVQLQWNDVDQGFHVFLIPFDTASNAVVEHYFWSRAVEGWWPDKFNNVEIQPWSSLTIDGGTEANRRMVLGGFDGKLRIWDSAALDDDGTAIDAHVLIGPLAPKETPYEVRYTRLQVVLASIKDGASFEFYATDTPDELGPAVYAGTLQAGRNPVLPARAVGSYVGLKIGNGSPNQSFAIESVEVDAAPGSRKRVRS